MMRWRGLSSIGYLGGGKRRERALRGAGRPLAPTAAAPPLAAFGLGTRLGFDLALRRHARLFES